MIRGHRKVIDALEGFEKSFAEVDDFGMEFKTSIVREIVRASAIDTTAMIQAVDWHRDPVTSSGYRFHVDTSNNPLVFYDGFVEFDTANRDGTIRKGRKFYEKGLQRADVERLVNERARRNFVI